MKPRWYFATTCVDSDGPSINALQERAKSISYRTLRSHLGETLTEVERALKYDTGTERGGLRMSKDWAVSCFKSEYRGEPCIGFVHSHIEHIFLRVQ